MTVDGELWHIVEAKRDDGTPTLFRIRELDPRPTLTKIFVVELPYPKTELSRLPNASAYRRMAEFDEQWLRPACTTLGWELVGAKMEDGACFVYMYGASDPGAMIQRLSPFDAGLGFYDDEDPQWDEYGTLRELLDQAKAIKPAPPPASAQQRAPARKPATKKPAKKNKPTKKPAKKNKPTKKPAKKNKPTKKPAKKKRR